MSESTIDLLLSKEEFMEGRGYSRDNIPQIYEFDGVIAPQSPVDEYLSLVRKHQGVVSLAAVHKDAYLTF